MTHVLITGGNRGIGLELARQCRARGDRVTVAVRRASPALEATGAEIVEHFDVTDDSAVQALVQHLGETGVDVLINCAGVLTRESLDDLDFDAIRRQMEVNAYGPLRVTRALLTNLGEGARVVIITSRMGSIADNTSGGMYGYRMSKAAVNMAGHSLAHDLAPRGIAVKLLHPGMVATDMTGGRGIPVEESVAGLLARIDEMHMDSSGSFSHMNGEALPW